MHQDGNSASNHHGEIAVNVASLVDDTCRDAEQQSLEDRDESREATHEDCQGNDKADPARHLVVLLSGIHLEESGASVGLLVAGNESCLVATGRVGVGGVIALNRIERVARTTLGNRLDNVLVGHNDPGTKGCHYPLDGSVPLFSVPNRVWTHQGLCYLVKVPCDGLHRQQNGH